MRVEANKLQQCLNKQLYSIYLLLGNEPLLIEESRKAIHQKAKKVGFNEFQYFKIERQLDWNQVFNYCQSFSLLSNKRIIELEICEKKEEINREVNTLIKMMNNDILLIIHRKILSKLKENQQCLNPLTSKCCFIHCFTPDIHQFPQFIQARCKVLGLKVDNQTIKMLAQWYEGNLFALSQSLEKLMLIYPDCKINETRLKESLSHCNHFSSFHWIDALLLAKPNRAQRILRQLKNEGIEAIVLIRIIQKELLKLLQMKYELNNSTLMQVFDKHKIWRSKHHVYISALSRLSFSILKMQIKLLIQCEMATKTTVQHYVSPWSILQELSVKLSIYK
ncbi:DNA polymerase III, delta subunit [Candidatus Photodesmus katoptron Akat1]|uniref:DNA polymerase III subunit delta n=2 Tax=Candidatus Photodesmus anomalopis TaxID=28176 RepID=S3DZL8_9GAMM|nr:DNA polymerase III, delta subunit [Candidatus Photodesmus katoptron Akat1]